MCFFLASPLYSNRRVPNEFWMATQQRLLSLSLTYLLKGTAHCLLRNFRFIDEQFNAFISIVVFGPGHFTCNDEPSPSESYRRAVQVVETQPLAKFNSRRTEWQRAFVHNDRDTDQTKSKETNDERHRSKSRVGSPSEQSEVVRSLFLDGIYLLRNCMSIGGPPTNPRPIYMSYKNKYVIISL